MNEAEERALNARIEQRAERLWREEGSPKVSRETYLDKARELIAIEDNAPLALEPVNEYTSDSAGREPVEPIEAVENQGEFPTLTDQGEEEVYPAREQHGAEPPIDVDPDVANKV